jgi:glycosyltransferase involved in cell wall biosynthesis
MTQPLVSVIIPTFNRAHLLPRAIRSVLDQSHRTLEVLVVDDGSTDNTREVAADFARCDGRVRYLYQDNRGVSGARNTGLYAAGGDYLAFLDSDDVWKPQKLDVQLACMRRLPHVGMVWSEMESVDRAGRIVNPRCNRDNYAAYQWFTYDRLFSECYRLDGIVSDCREPLGDQCVYAGDLYSAIVVGNLMLPSTVLLSRDRFEKIGGVDEEMHAGEDHEYHLRACREGPVAFIDLSLVQYQRGLDDHLTGERYTIASNYLRTITRAIERDPDRIRLPRRLLRWTLGYANSWTGEELMKMGEHRRARPYLARSLWHRWLQPRVLAQLGLSYFSPAVAASMCAGYRRVKRLWRQPGTAWSATNARTPATTG